MWKPCLESLTARSKPHGLEGAGQFKLVSDDSQLRLSAEFPASTSAPVSITALPDTCCFLLEIGEGPWPAQDALLRYEKSKIETVEKGKTYASGDVGIELDALHVRFEDLKSQDTILETVGHELNVGNIPMRFPIFKHSSSSAVGISFGLGHGELIYGFGEDFGRIVKNGRSYDFVNADALGVSGEHRYQSTPTMVSNRGWSLTVLTREPCRVDVGHTRSEVLTIFSSVERLRILLQFHPNAAVRISQLRHLLAGGRPLPSVPKWSLHLWLSRCYYKNQKEVEEVVNGAREMDFPAGVVNLDARCWMRPHTRTDFVWDLERLEPFEKYIPSLRSRGFEVCLWENPYVSCATETLHAEGARRGFFAKTSTGEPYPLQWVPEGLPGFPKPPDAGLVDFTNPEARKWWKDLHRPFLRAGVKCFKTDFGEEIPYDAHFFDGSTGWDLRNAYADLYNTCISEVVREECGDQGILWARSGWLHTFTYPVKWGGDSHTNFRALRGSLRAALSQAFGGALFWSYDIGGFYGAHPSPLFFLRAFQMGMYFSHARCHGITEREPWRFGDHVTTLCRTAAKARMALLPYFEQVCVDSSKEGQSFVRPLWLLYPQDRTTYNIDDQFFAGKDLMVAPFLENSSKRAVYMPNGVWMDLRNGEEYEGGQWHTFENVAHSPAFWRSGSAFESTFRAAQALFQADQAITVSGAK
jgi:alpha-D-xyloside xylohydrolase